MNTFTELGVILLEERVIIHSLGKEEFLVSHNNGASLKISSLKEDQPTIKGPPGTRRNPHLLNFLVKLEYFVGFW